MPELLSDEGLARCIREYELDQEAGYDVEEELNILYDEQASRDLEWERFREQRKREAAEKAKKADPQ